MDQDILTADAPTLERIRVQLYRDQVAAGKVTTGFITSEAGFLLTKEQELRRDIVCAIAANYMKPTTGTLPETIAADTANDAARLRAAVDAVAQIVLG